MNISGLNALDPRVAATEKFISDKKIPPEQVPQFLMSMGADPRLAGLVMRFQRLKSASAQSGDGQKPQTTVAQDVEAQQRGIAAPMAPIQGRDQGIAALPAPAMDRAKFADGGIVAFQEGGNEGLDDIDFTKMTTEQLEMLASGGDRNMAKAAYRERLRRSGYRTPGQIASDVGTGVSEFFANTRIAGGAPDYMRDEQGRIRTPANEAGAKSLTSSFTQGTVPFKPPAAAAPVAAPSAVASPSAAAMTPGQAGSAFDAAIGRARQDVRQDQRPPARVTRPGGVDTAFKGAQQINEGIQILRDQVKELKNLKPEDREARYRAAGIEDMTPKQLAKIEERISKLSGDKKRDAYMALAQAGFKMAAAASRPGATVLGAFGEGASEGAKMMADINKEYRGLQSDLEDKVMALQRYQQERKEGKIDRDIEYERDLAKEIRGTEAKIGELSEQARQFNIEVGLKREQIAATTLASQPKAEERLKNDYIRAKTDKERQAILKQLSDLRGVDVRILAEELKAEAALERERAKNSFGGFGDIGGFTTSSIDEELRRRGAL
jgi:hypothetical protein